MRISVVSISVAAAIAWTAIMAGPCAAQMTNNVWAADQTTGTLYVFETSGILATQVAPVSTLARPTAIAIGESGQAYVALSTAGQILRRSADGSVSSIYNVGTSPTGLAFDAAGDLWVTDGLAPSVYRVDVAGAVQATISPLGATTFGPAIAVSRFNEVWAGGVNDAIYRYTTSGTALATITTTAHVGLRALAVDRNGDCWAAYQSGAVVRYDRSTSLPVVTVTDSPAPTAVAVNNFDELYVANAVSGRVVHYSNQGVTLTSVATGDLLGTIGLDGNGDVWAASTGNGRIYKFGRYTLSSLGSWSVGTNPLIAGDFTGYVQANILRVTQQDDFDNDGEDNLAELDAGSNPFDAASTPTNPRPILHGVPRPGATVRLSCRQSTDPTLGFAVGGSLGNNPQNYIPVPGTSSMIPLENDAFFRFVGANFWHFQNIGGFLDANGEAVTTIHIPNAPALIATTWYFAFVTLDNTKIPPVIHIANNLPVTVRP